MKISLTQKKYTSPKSIETLTFEERRILTWVNSLYGYIGAPEVFGLNEDEEYFFEKSTAKSPSLVYDAKGNVTVLAGEVCKFLDTLEPVECTRSVEVEFKSSLLEVLTKNGRVNYPSREELGRVLTRSYIDWRNMDLSMIRLQSVQQWTRGIALVIEDGQGSYLGSVEIMFDIASGMDRICEKVSFV
ncbi:MAG: hypothetical protein ACRCX2_15690 [Paraclostridium sp.]